MAELDDIAGHPVPAVQSPEVPEVAGTVLTFPPQQDPLPAASDAVGSFRETPAWPMARLLYLATAWNAGKPSTQIAREMGTTKNAIVGKAHRLKLPSRPSPILVRPANEPSPERRSSGRVILKPAVTLAPLASVTDIRPPPPPAPPAPPPRIPAKSKPVEIVRAAPPAPRRVAPSHPCLWLSGTTRPYTPCCALALPGRSYCDEHDRRAHGRPKPPTEEACASSKSTLPASSPTIQM